MQEEGIVQPSHSPLASPIVMVHILYQELTIYRLPEKGEDGICSTIYWINLEFFTTLDMASGYWQAPGAREN